MKVGIFFNRNGKDSKEHCTILAIIEFPFLFSSNYLNLDFLEKKKEKEKRKKNLTEHNVLLKRVYMLQQYKEWQ